MMRRWWRAFWRGVACVLVSAVLAAASADAAEPLIPNAVGSFVRLQPEGQPALNIYVEEIGKGPPILLLHGLGGSSHYWRMLAPRLATTHRVISLDLRGFGRSDKPFDQLYGVADHAAVVRAFIRAANLKQITLVGHSYGGIVALRLAMDRTLEPNRIARLVAMSAPAFPQRLSGGVSFMQKPVLPYLALLVVPPEVTTRVALMMEAFGFDKVTDRDISIYADPLASPGGPHALIQTARQIVPPDIDLLLARYAYIAKPTLALWCRRDQVVPLTTGEQLARAIPRARLAVLDGCDHMPAEQNPTGVALEIRRFLGR